MEDYCNLPQTPRWRVWVPAVPGSKVKELPFDVAAETEELARQEVLPEKRGKILRVECLTTPREMYTVLVETPAFLAEHTVLATSSENAQEITAVEIRLGKSPLPPDSEWDIRGALPKSFADKVDH